MGKLVFAAACALIAGTVNANAQGFPSRPITMIVPFAAGGPTDIIARIIAERMRMSLGQPIIVESVTGAAGSIGVGRAARGAPDGYTLSIGHYGTHAVNSLIYSLQYDVVNDFEPIALLPSNPYIIGSRNGVPATDLKGLIAWLKANPDKAAGATGGLGSPGHLIWLKFQNETGTRFQLLPYRGGSGPSTQDLLAGHIDLKVEQAAQTLPLVQSGQIRAYAVTAETRLAAAPDIPTVDEAGLPGFYISAWHGLWVPKGTPTDVIAKLNAAVVDALADPAVRKRLAELGQEIPPREQQTAEALAAHHKAEIEKWWPLIKAANIKAE
jgi:tripartite-type tricarboxylate transporter receptor subunit TctC